MEYIDFLKNKMAISHNTGFDINDDELTPTLYPHVKDTVRWAIKGGCRAVILNPVPQPDNEELTYLLMPMMCND
jgi:hypothetical protein